jgi:hypothetical protein
MIRRGIWLVLGATLGVGGYRRASRLARSLTPAGRGTQTGRGTEPGRGARAGARRSHARRSHASRSHAGRPAARRTGLTSRQVLRFAGRAGRSAAGGAAFVRDVRDGMAEYLDRHGQETGRTLGSQECVPAPAQRRRAAP